MPTTIVRDSSIYGPLAITSDPATTTGFSLNLLSGAVVMVDSVSPGTTATMRFYMKQDARDSTSYLMVNSTNSPLEVTIQAGRAFELPTELFAVRQVLPVVTTGTASVRVVVKA